MKASKSILKASATLFVAAILFSSCSKGTSCPAYAGAKKYKKNASWAMLETSGTDKQI